MNGKSGKDGITVKVRFPDALPPLNHPFIQALSTDPCASPAGYEVLFYTFTRSSYFFSITALPCRAETRVYTLWLQCFYLLPFFVVMAEIGFLYRMPRKRAQIFTFSEDQQGCKLTIQISNSFPLRSIASRPFLFAAMVFHSYSPTS